MREEPRSKKQVALDPGTYRGTYKLVAGRPSLDFANLVSYRGTKREHDWLDPPGNLRRWAVAAGLPTSLGRRDPSPRALRETVARVFLLIAEGEPPPARDLRRIGELAAAAWRGRRLTLLPDGDAATWKTIRPSLIAEVAVDAANLLTSPDDLARLAICGGCRWLFLDTTRNRTRRWCDPADCGNRARQRRHYRRRRATGS